jgi:hypothetical protein
VSAAVVFVHYRLPESRLRDHLRWNAAAYQSAGVGVVVVVEPASVDRLQGADWWPAWAQAIPYRRPMDVFSLSRTKNLGIRAAIDRGDETVVATDADIVFPADALTECLSVGDRQAVAPVYHMVSSHEERHLMSGRVITEAAIGTVAMRVDGWLSVCGYHEELEGYGCDDGDLWRRIGLAGIAQLRGIGCYHIAHEAGTIQQEAHMPGDKTGGVRKDHWGRGDGFNPNRLRENRRISQLSRWRNQQWGRP